MIEVAVNALAIPSFRQGGAGFYTVTLIDGLSRRADVDATAVVTPELRSELPDLAPEARVSLAQASARGRAGRMLNLALAARAPTRLDMRWDAAIPPRTQVVHWPISFMHAPGGPPGARKVLTVLDLQHEFFPEFFSRTDRALRKLRWGPSARAADHIVAISEFTKQTVCDRYGVPSERVSVVPLWARASFLDGRPADPGLVPEPLRGRRFLLYPASPLPAKNHARLLEAFGAAMRDAGDTDTVLALSGPRLHSWAPVERAIAQAGVGDRVVQLGHVSDAELRALYGHAQGMVFPSLFEGFGLPVVEAMGNGCPVACSRVASLPEVAADAARLFDPTSVDDLAGAIRWLAALDGQERADTVAAGRAQAARFAPDRLVSATVDVYRKVLP